MHIMHFKYIKILSILFSQYDWILQNNSGIMTDLSGAPTPPP